MEIIKPGTNFDFVGKRNIFITVSGILCLISLVVILSGGLNYGIDFKGGTEITIQFMPEKMGGKTPNIDELRAALKNIPDVNAEVQTFGDKQGEYLLKMQQITHITQAKTDGIKKALADKFGEDKIKRFIVSTEGSDKIEFILSKKQAPKDEAQQPANEGEEKKQDAQEVPVKKETAAATDADGKVIPADAFSPEEVKSVFKAAGAPAYDVNVGQSVIPDSYRYTITLEGIYDNLRKGLDDKYGAGTHQLLKLDTVGAKVGAKLKWDAIIAVMISWIGILLYIALRFEFAFAPGGVLALIHDTLIVIGVMAALRLEFTMSSIAALLTLIGYSINDTIVIYDRIRENMPLLRKMTIEQVFNKAINETLSRTVLTAFTVFLTMTILAVMTFGDVRNFAIVMVMGSIIGTYSSIFIAAPLVIYIYKREKAKEAAVKK